MTLCFFSAQYLPTVGGVERYTWNLARRAAAAGHRAIVVTSALPGLPERETGPDGVAVYRLPSWLLMGGRFPVLRPLARSTRRLAAALWAERPDFCLVQTRLYPLCLWAARGARRRGIPAILVDHSTGHMPMGGGPIGALAALYEHAACAFLKRQGLDFYGVSEAVCGWLRHFGVESAGTLYNAVDPEEIARVAAGGAEAAIGGAEAALGGAAEKAANAPEAAGGADKPAPEASADADKPAPAPEAAPQAAPPPGGWREALGLAPNTLLVVFAGRLIPEKGPGLLAEAYALLPEVLRRRCAVLIAGDGPMRPALESSAPAGVRLLGSLPHPALLRLLAEADLYCLPTGYAEGFPTTLLEAAGCGCAILCSDTAGSAELLPDERYGLRLPADALTPEALAAALARALTDDAWRAAAAENARARLCERFTWDAVSARLLAIVAKKMT